MKLIQFLQKLNYINKKNRSISNSFFINIIYVALTSIVLIGIYTIIEEYRRFNIETNELKNSFIESQKLDLKNEIENVVNYIDYKKSILYQL